jgi:hypothetical protein
MSNWLQTGNSNQLQSIEQFKRNKQEYQASQRRIMETIQRNTRHEVKQVEQAINNLNQKVDVIMKTPEMKKEESSMKQSQKMMFLSLQTALKAFKEGSDAIDQRTDLPPADKQKYQTALHEKLLEKLYTPEEIDKFKKMFSNMVVVIPKGLPMSSGGNMKQLTGQIQRNSNVSDQPIYSHQSSQIHRVSQMDIPNHSPQIHHTVHTNQQPIQQPIQQSYRNNQPGQYYR